MSAETNWFQVIAIMFTISATAVGAIIGLTKFLGKTERKQSVATTVIENTVKEIEGIKNELSKTRQQISDGHVVVARLEERLEYLKERLEEICRKMDRLANNRHDERSDNERYGRRESES